MPTILTLKTSTAIILKFPAVIFCHLEKPLHHRKPQQPLLLRHITLGHQQITTIKSLLLHPWDTVIHKDIKLETIKYHHKLKNCPNDSTTSEDNGPSLSTHKTFIISMPLMIFPKSTSICSEQMKNQTNIS